jgi:hypothetical protein
MVLPNKLLENGYGQELIALSKLKGFKDCDFKKAAESLKVRKVSA